jgi:hypothetical protein
MSAKKDWHPPSHADQPRRQDLGNFAEAVGGLKTARPYLDAGRSLTWRLSLNCGAVAHMPHQSFAADFAEK